MMVKISEHVRGKGKHRVFTCPICGKEIKAYHYPHAGYWKMACANHIIMKHRGKMVKKGVVEVD